MFGVHIVGAPYLPFRERIKKVGSLITVEKGKNLLSQLLDQDLCIYVDGGMLIYSGLKNNGEKQIMQAFGQGSIFPVWKLDRKLASYAQLIAYRMGVTGYLMPRGMLQQMEEQEPGMAEARELELMELIAHLTTVPLLYQDGTGLARVANAIYFMNVEKGTSTVPMTQSDIAQLTGMTRTQVTRILSKLRQAGIICTRRNQIVVRDWDRLLQQTTEIARDICAM